MDVNRALFLSLTASIFGSAALSLDGCDSNDTPSGSASDAAQDAALASDAMGVADRTVGDGTADAIADSNAAAVTDGGDGTADVTTDSNATAVTDGTLGDGTTDAIADSNATGVVDVTAGDAAADGIADATADAIGSGALDALSDQESGDSNAGDTANDSPNASDGADASSLPPLSDGGISEACAPFTCELGQANCLAAYGGGVGQDVAVALYACAQTVCATDGGVSSFAAGTNCATAALSATAPDPSVTSFCASSASCAADAGMLGVSQCEGYFSSLTPGALARVQEVVLHDAGLRCNDTTSLTFEVLGILANP